MLKPNAAHDLRFEGSSPRWDEGIPLGNGLLGAVVWGDGAPLRLSLDRSDLWDTRPAPETLSPNFAYKNLIRLVQEKDAAAIRRDFEAFYGDRPAPTRLLAGRLELDFGRPADSFAGRLSLARATAEVRLAFGRKRSLLRTFLHATDRFGYLSIRGDAPLPDVRLAPPAFLTPCRPTQGTWVSKLDYPPAEPGAEDDLLWLRQKTREPLEWAIVVALRRGRAGSLRLAYVVAASSDGPDWFDAAKAKVKRIVAPRLRDRQRAARAHLAWWKSFWAKSSIDLPDALAEKDWYVNNYLFASSSRAGAPAVSLQGVWTEDEGRIPPWKGDYHHDLNTEMCYWHYMKANHLQEGRAFVDFLWDLLPQARAFARSFFDAPGICLPSVMTIKGQPLGGWVMYCTDLINQAWLCQAFDHYWRYSGDDDFLRARAYPYFRETAECLLRWLAPGKDGKLLLPLSSSPEIHSNALNAWLTPNSNNDLALLIYLFRTLAEMSDLLGAHERPRWEGVLAQLPELAVNDKNVLMLSPDESLAESHRHLAHAMPIYPLELLLPSRSDREKTIIDATIANLEVLGKGNWIGLSYPWMALLYAAQGNGEGAAYHLKVFHESFCSRNGFHLNGDFRGHGVSAHRYRPFTVEANFAAAAALQDMLLGTSGGVLRLFPAVPADWARAGLAFRDLRAPGAVLVSARLIGGRLRSVGLKAEKDARVKIVNSFAAERLACRTARGARAIRCAPGDVFEIPLRTGARCVVTPA
ncbi:MAG: glycoside hydrolase N-terminal domain-containing protein [Planctomycetota bacterium]